jgi:acid stress-induced BolA-like protein IbaG/YrbA
MLRTHLDRLFTKYDPVIQSLISEVLTLEQAHISMQNFHFKEPIDQIISRLATKELERVEREDNVSRSLFDEA